MGLLDLTADLLDRFASPDPTPGRLRGGPRRALGAALVAMVSRCPRRGRAPEERERLTRPSAGPGSGRAPPALVDDDTEAYDAVVAAYRLPKGTDEEKAARKAAVAAAMAGATEVPLRTAEACLVVLSAARREPRPWKPNAF